MSQLPARGTLFSVEGLSGVGKTYLTQAARDALPPEIRPELLDEFSARTLDADERNLGTELLTILKDASHREAFLRSGAPGSETLLLLAIKTHDYEHWCRPLLSAGRNVVEGRGLHSTAVYQSLILNPDDDAAALRYATILLDLARRWRPLPDTTVLIIDDIQTALQRAEHRDRRTYTPEQRTLHHRAHDLFLALATEDPDRITVIDRRALTEGECVEALCHVLSTPAALWRQPSSGGTSRDPSDHQINHPATPGPRTTPPTRSTPPGQAGR